jgi:hypothetical protein
MSAPNIKIEIDWKKVDEFLIAGSPITEIAGYFGTCRENLYIRFEKEFGYTLSTHAKQKRQKGESILRAHQYAKALGLTEKGDNTLLIWLGKTRLKQTEIKQENIKPQPIVFEWNYSNDPKNPIEVSPKELPTPDTQSTQ